MEPKLKRKLEASYNERAPVVGVVSGPHLIVTCLAAVGLFPSPYLPATDILDDL